MNTIWYYLQYIHRLWGTEKVQSNRYQLWLASQIKPSVCAQPFQYDYIWHWYWGTSHLIRGLLKPLELVIRIPVRYTDYTLLKGNCIMHNVFFVHALQTVHTCSIHRNINVTLLLQTLSARVTQLKVHLAETYSKLSVTDISDGEVKWALPWRHIKLYIKIGVSSRKC